MNNLLIILILFFLAFNSGAQTEERSLIVGKKFKTDIVLGSTDYGWTSNTKSVSLSDPGKDPWGYFLQLNEDGTFVAYNQNSCGNDCRVKVSGTFTLENGVVEFITNTIVFMDICVTRPRQVVNASIGSFAIHETETKLSLVRIR